MKRKSEFKRSGKANTSPTNQFRIIAGEFRHRVLNFPNVHGLRPTTERVRETLFNWLQLSITGSKCLDLFAGSGSLGFEAISRGADSVTALDYSHEVITHIQSNCAALGSKKFFSYRQDVFAWLKQFAEKPYDLIFLDPPYDLGILQDVITLLGEKQVLAPGGFLYLEDRERLEGLSLPANWQLIRSKKAGQVHYGLCQHAIGLDHSNDKINN